MRVPCVMRWPRMIEAGVTTDEVMSTLDLLPTLAALAGAGRLDGPPIDGHDMRSVLSGSAPGSSPRKSFYYYFKDQLQAVRADRWKLHLARTEQQRQLPPRLHDLATDIGETVNVADANPDVVARLRALALRARNELGDRGRQGQGQRPAAIMEDPRPLRRRDQR